MWKRKDQRFFVFGALSMAESHFTIFFFVSVVLVECLFMRKGKRSPLFSHANIDVFQVRKPSQATEKIKYNFLFPSESNQCHQQSLFLDGRVFGPNNSNNNKRCVNHLTHNHCFFDKKKFSFFLSPHLALIILSAILSSIITLFVSFQFSDNIIFFFSFLFFSEHKYRHNEVYSSAKLKELSLSAALTLPRSLCAY